MKYECTNCGTDVHRPPSRVKDGQEIFCSKECRDESKGNGMMKRERVRILKELIRERGKVSTSEMIEYLKNKIGVHVNRSTLRNNLRDISAEEMYRKKQEGRYAVVEYTEGRMKT